MIAPIQHIIERGGCTKPFGAVQFYVFEHPEEYEEVAGMWSELKPHFERKIWGVSFEL